MNRPGARVATPEPSGSPPATLPFDAPAGRRAVRVILFALGLGALVAMLAAIGWKPIAANLAQIDGWFFALVLLYALPQLSFAAGWWSLLGARPRPVSFGALFAAYLAGDSVNYVTTVGGEPVKAQLLKESLGFSRAFAAVAVHRHADVLAQWLFLMVGVGVALTRFSLPLAARLSASGGLLVFGGLLLWLTLGLRRGAFRPFVAWLGRFRPLGARMAALDGKAELLDARIREFYADGANASFWIAVAWGLAGWCGGLLETYIVLKLLAPSSDWAAAFTVESLSMIANTLLLFVPARVGTAEGIRAGVTILVGLTPAQGVAYGLVRRARELLWVLPGAIVLLKHHLLGIGILRLSRPPLERGARG